MSAPIQEPGTETQRMWQLCQATPSGMLATVDHQGHPAASYVPVYLRDHSFFVFTSRLAAHTQHLLACSEVSLLIVDSNAPANLFARHRVQFFCKATSITRTASVYEPILQGMQSVLGETVSLLKQLDDFVLFRLNPQRALFIEGFGRAFEMQGHELADVVHLSADRLKSRQQSLSNSL